MHGIPLSRWLFPTAVLLLLLLAGRPWLEHWLITLSAEPRAVTARGDLARDEAATVEIFEAVSPSVVSITTTEPDNSPWTRNPHEVRRGTGSGFVWDELGHIVTNFHVVDKATSARVRLADQRRFRAELIGASPAHDLAVLRIDVPISRPRPLPIGTSADLRVGQKVFAIGNPFGLDSSLTTGIVSALDRTIYSEDGMEIRRLIQTDAAINPGNSGGPLIDSAGRLIGVNTAIYSSTGGFSGIGFAVPVDIVNRVVPQLVALGRYVRPRIGIVADDEASRIVLTRLGIAGVLILRVEPQSPGARAGLVPTRLNAAGEVIPGDVIQSVDGETVARMSDLIDLLDHYEIGDEVMLGIFRNGAVEVVAVTLGGQPPGLD